MKNVPFTLGFGLILISVFNFCATPQKKENNAKDSLQITLKQDSIAYSDTSYAYYTTEEARLENDSFLTYQVNLKKQTLY